MVAGITGIRRGGQHVFAVLHGVEEILRFLRGHFSGLVGLGGISAGLRLRLVLVGNRFASWSGWLQAILGQLRVLIAIISLLLALIVGRFLVLIADSLLLAALLIFLLSLLTVLILLLVAVLRLILW